MDKRLQTKQSQGDQRDVLFILKESDAPPI